MWLINNNSNRPFLSQYRNLVIENFWDFWIEMAAISRIRIKIDRPDFLENYINSHGSFDIRFLDLNKTGQPDFRSLTVAIIKFGLSVLKKQRKIFNDQNDSVSLLDYNFNHQVHPRELTIMFKLYFYERGWEIPWIWIDVVGMTFDRTIFLENFSLDNKLSVCPYCDLATTPGERSAWIEHFMPKDRFPYLSCNPDNVMPSCNACNVAGTGKGTAYKNPVTNPFRQQIGDDLQFRLVGNLIEIENNANAEIENFLTLLKTRRRYRGKNVQRSVFSTLTSTYDLISRLSPANTDIIFQDYIKDIGKEQGHYFARRTLVEDIVAIRASRV